MSSVIRFGTCAKDGAIEPDHGARHLQQHPPVGQVLEPADGGLRAQVAPARQPLQRHLEYRVGAQRVGVDAVLVACRDHQHAEPQDVGHAVDRARRIARIVDAGREPPGDIEPPLDFTQGSRAPRPRTAIRRRSGPITVLPFTGDRPGSGGVVSFMAGGVLPTCEFWRQQPKLYRKSGAWTTSASLDAYFGLGSGTHNQKMTVAAIQIALMKVWAQRSYRVAMRRQSLSLPNMRSMRLRCL